MGCSERVWSESMSVRGLAGHRSQHHRPRRIAIAATSLLLASTALASPSSPKWSEPQQVAELAAPSVTPAPTSAPAIKAANPALEDGEALVLDTRIPYFDGQYWTMGSPAENELRKRASVPHTVVPSSVTVTVSAPDTSGIDTASQASSTSSSGGSSSTASSTTSTSTSPPSPLPSPFDGGLSNNFTASSNGACPLFINNLLDDPTFLSCYPISILLQSSTSFFQAEKSLVSTTQVLDAACKANVTFCTSYLSSVATNLTSSANCQADYQLGNPVVTQAYLAMTAYQPIYSATCLKDPVSKEYCFADAVTNTTNPTGVYFYYLPLNMTLPGGTEPNCDTCLKQTMGIYQLATANRAQPIASTYLDAATQVNTICGPNFVNASLPSAIMSRAAETLQRSGWMAAAMILGTAVALAM